MTPLEINAAGRPVIAFRAGGAVETVLHGLTGLFFDSTFGGMFAAMQKRAGFEAITITGRAPQPVYLLVHEDGAEIKPAADLWGPLSSGQLKLPVDSVFPFADVDQRSGHVHRARPVAGPICGPRYARASGRWCRRCTVWVGWARPASPLRLP